MYLTVTLHIYGVQDWTQKGLFIFSYLSLNINQESLPIMEAFRSFNRSGSGAVNIEEFVIGMVENLFTLYKNISVLGSIAEEVLAIENRSSELAARLEKEAAGSEKLVQFRSNMMSLLYLVRDKLRHPPKNANYAVNLTPDLLIRLAHLRSSKSTRSLNLTHCHLLIVYSKGASCKPCATPYCTSTSQTSGLVAFSWSMRLTSRLFMPSSALTAQVKIIKYLFIYLCTRCKYFSHFIFFVFT